jgi:hypothetical protein
MATPDLFVTNFSEDVPTLYRNLGKWTFADITAQEGLSRYLQFLGWGTFFFDEDNDGWGMPCLTSAELRHCGGL